MEWNLCPKIILWTHKKWTLLTGGRYSDVIYIYKTYLKTVIVIYEWLLYKGGFLPQFIILGYFPKVQYPVFKIIACLSRKHGITNTFCFDDFQKKERMQKESIFEEKLFSKKKKSIWVTLAKVTMEIDSS